MNDVVIVGYAPEDRGKGGLGLGRVLAQTSGMQLVVACVVPDRWRSGGKALGFDRDYHDFQVAQAETALAVARETLDEHDVDVRYEVVSARSAPAGLMKAAEDLGAAVIVAGSSSGGLWGHIALGSVTHRLVRGSKVPVALSPRGGRYDAEQRIDRITLAFDATPASRRVLRQTAQVAVRFGQTLRVVTFALRTPRMHPQELGFRVEDRVVEEWQQQVKSTLQDAVAGLDADLKEAPELLVCEDETWGDVLEEPDWEKGDVLVIGSSASEPRWSRVFLGSTAARILRHSPVPTVVVP